MIRSQLIFTKNINLLYMCNKFDKQNPILQVSNFDEYIVVILS